MTTKYIRKLALLVAITLPLVFAGCATQVPQEEPPKQELPVVPKIGNDILSSPPETPASRSVEPPNVVEELPVIAEESTALFTLSSATLSYKEKQKLEIIAERLVADRNLQVSLIGYAIDNGSSSLNLAVSDNRVASVAEFLRRRGVQSGQIRVQALGSEKIPSNCRSSKCRQQFRRVDLVITKSR